jgi:hypothetical protein
MNRSREVISLERLRVTPTLITKVKAYTGLARWWAVGQKSEARRSHPLSMGLFRHNRIASAVTKGMFSALVGARRESRTCGTSGELLAGPGPSTASGTPPSSRSSGSPGLGVRLEGGAHKPAEPGHKPF